MSPFKHQHPYLHTNLQTPPLLFLLFSCSFISKRQSRIYREAPRLTWHRPTLLTMADIKRFFLTRIKWFGKHDRSLDIFWLRDLESRRLAQWLGLRTGNHEASKESWNCLLSLLWGYRIYLQHICRVGKTPHHTRDLTIIPKYLIVRFYS